MTPTEKPRWQNFELHDSPSLTVPSVRMVIVQAWCDHGETWHQFYPVLAIQAAMKRHLVRDNDESYRTSPPAPELAGDYGWEWSYSEIVYNYLIVEEDYGLTTAEGCLDMVNSVWKAFVADWPGEEDEDRLSGEISELKRDAASKEAKNQARRAAREEGVSP